MDLYEGYQKIVEALLTYIETSYTIDTSEVLFLYGLFVTFVISFVLYFLALNQSPVKWERRRSWVK